MIKKSKKARKRGRMVRDLDAAARQEVFERDGHVCVRCRDTKRGIQWAHIFSRRHKNLRWEPDNALTLCAGCHIFWHQYPLLAVDWFKTTWPERYEHILTIFNSGMRIRVEDLHAEL
jgi:5-methylcytosine-specific restriction endonuclease McrA